ncbi:DUF167 domain-containing protein [Patescibacteria group bacterium]|nr:DUF167 domain-containing protein [Patescibacteria group bacterium]
MYIKVKVFPKSKKESLEKIKDFRFEIRIKEKAEKNMANKRVLELLAEYFKIRVKDVKIISGHHHPVKLLSVDENVLNLNS